MTELVPLEEDTPEQDEVIATQPHDDGEPPHGDED